MKIIFAQYSSFPSFGAMSVSAILRAAGHRTELLLKDEERDLAGAIRARQPDLVAVPVITGEHRWAAKLIAALKPPGIPVVLGGPHPTFYPEAALRLGTSLAIRGEAEGAILDIIAAGADPAKLAATPNLAVLVDGKPVVNAVRPLIADLDGLPDPDRELYYRYPWFGKASVKQFLTGRGCPYECTFCANHLLKSLYAGKGAFIRRRSPARVIAEMKEVRARWGFRTVTFTDDTFVLDRDWLREFLPRFTREIGAPFLCNVRANLVDAELVALLKEHGAFGVAMGIESAREHLRETVLTKGITNEQIRTAGRLVKGAGLVLKTYNILNLPGETFADGVATMQLNAELKSDHPAASLLQPYPDYAITVYAQAHGHLAADYSVENVGESIYEDSPVRNPDTAKLVTLQNLFFLGAKFPRLLPWVVATAERARPNPLFKALAKLLYGFYAIRAHRLTPGDVLRLVRHVRVFKI